MNKLKKTAVITGASEGIGAALVNELLQDNYKVIAISRNLKKLSKLKSFNSKYKSNSKSLISVQMGFLVQSLQPRLNHLHHCSYHNFHL